MIIVKIFDFLENWVIWGEMLKNKGDFNAAIIMYKNALKLNGKDQYLKNELKKLIIITEKNIDKVLSESIVELSKTRVGFIKQYKDICSNFFCIIV